MASKVIVIPEELKSASQDFFNLRGEISNVTQEMIEVVHSMQSVFEGEASTAYRSQFDKLEPDMKKIHNMVQEHSTDLQEMANEYARAESENVQTSNAQKGGILA